VQPRPCWVRSVAPWWATGWTAARNPHTAGAVYRITLQTDGGAWRTYDVGSTDLRVGERVRVENGQIYRA
jgi:hypothetical protein